MLKTLNHVIFTLFIFQDFANTTMWAQEAQICGH
jgi:hypothetical protein